jgi:hypothetical protein
MISNQIGAIFITEEMSLTLKAFLSQSMPNKAPEGANNHHS